MSNVTAYVMTVWVNLPTKSSPIDASNLNHVEQGIKNVTDFVNTINAESGMYLSQTPFTTALKNKLDGIEANANNYTLPTASTSTKGGVKVDGTTITIDENGVITSTASASQLSNLTDVNLTQLADGQILKWDATNSKWVNSSEAEVRTQLSLLEDVDIDDETLVDGQVLKYNAASEKWENGESVDVLGYDETLQVLGDPAQNVPSIPVVYSTDEHAIGKWIDGKPLYQKTIDFGALPNNTTKSVLHNILNVENIWVYDGFVKTSNSDNFFPLVFYSDGTTAMWRIWAELTDISIQTYNDRSSFSAYVTIRYTKTTDQIPNI